VSRLGCHVGTFTHLGRNLLSRLSRPSSKKLVPLIPSSRLLLQ
jgi:hypothetical protein